MDMKWRLAIGICAAAAAVGAVLALTHHQDVATKRGHAVAQLRDPDSVQFRNERLTDGGWLCGEMNGKNAYGAYTGFKRFMAMGAYDAWIEGSGYVGQKRHAIGQSELITESLRAEIEVLDARKEQWDKGVPPPDLTDGGIKEIADKRLFSQKWDKHCA